MPTLPKNFALSYTENNKWPVFPCNWRPGPKFKRPLVADWNEVATCDPIQIEAWWTKEPKALIGVPTGAPSGFVVLDVDVKDPAAYGFDSLDELGFAILPPTRMAHTSSGGLHLHFQPPEHGIRNTAGTRGRGIGPGLDWRGDGGYVVVPSEGSGYSWDPHYGLDFPLAAVPAELLPREPKRESVTKPVERADGLSPYARAALDQACRHIIAATAGEQEATLHGEAFSIGTLAGAGSVPEGFAIRALIWAATQIPSYDTRRPWRQSEIENKVRRSFAAGLSHPREVRRHG